MWTFIRHGLAATLLMMMMAGCVAQREPVALVEPTFSYQDQSSEADLAGLWQESISETTSVQAALAEGGHQPAWVAP